MAEDAKDARGTDDDAPIPRSDEPAVDTKPSVAPPKAPERAKRHWLAKDSRSRRVILGFAIYIVCSAVFAIVAGRDLLTVHTAFNHYAQLADAWAHGHQNLVNGPPGYAMGNDFAEFEGRTYISFPPFPAILMLIPVWAAGSPENFQDGQFILWLAGIGPAVLFLVLEKLRRTGRSERSEWQNIFFALLFAFGTVYFFTAVQGTVWFAAHVVAVGTCALFALCAIDAERPWLAGIAMACTWTSRPSMLALSLFFVLEAIRVSCKEGLPTEGTVIQRFEAIRRRVDRDALLRRLAGFGIPVFASLALASYYNYSRFHLMSPLAFGHEFLTVGWRTRIDRWGLAGYHYLAKNLGVMLTILPWRPPHGVDSLGGAAFKINEHGLALWFTTPIYFWLFRPKKTSFVWWSIAISALIVTAGDLLYQNSGWQQFGYRFSNDYAVFLFMLLAITNRPIKWLFGAACVWGVAWSLFGALTFHRVEFDKYYFRDGTQTILYQQD